MIEPATDLLELLEEARQVTTFHQRCMAYHERLTQYWQQRAKKLETQLPALVEAEMVAKTEWEAQCG